jgi:hypothetical protein
VQFVGFLHKLLHDYCDDKITGITCDFGARDQCWLWLWMFACLEDLFLDFLFQNVSSNDALQRLILQLFGMLTHSLYYYPSFFDCCNLGLTLRWSNQFWRAWTWTRMARFDDAKSLHACHNGVSCVLVSRFTPYETERLLLQISKVLRVWWWCVMLALQVGFLSDVCDEFSTIGTFLKIGRCSHFSLSHL